MANVTEFTVEGDAVLGFSSDDGSQVFIDGKRVEQLIAEMLGFPDEAEFDEMITRLSALREQGLMPATGEPDISREGLRLSIEVKVI
jgi:hypothetical protein